MLSGGTLTSLAHSRSTIQLLVIAVAIAGTALYASPASAAPGATQANSASPGETQADKESSPVAISKDGRYAYFRSSATNLAPGLATGQHLYRRDLLGKSTDLVDISHTGSAPSAEVSSVAFASADGRWAVFHSRAGNLVPADRNGIEDIFIRDMDQQTTELVSVATDGTQSNGWASPAGVSDDGRFVVFQSTATNLVPGGTAPGVRHVYLRDRLLQTTEVILEVPSSSIAPGWTPVVSPDGGAIAYDLLLPGPAGTPVWTTIRHDLSTGDTEVASVATDGTPANAQTNVAALGDNGDFVLLRSAATNLVRNDTNGHPDVFVRNVKRGITRMASVADDASLANGPSVPHGISANGRYVAFSSTATNLTPVGSNNIRNVFVRDRQGAGATHLVSVATDGGPADGTSDAARISAQGRFVLFASSATNLVDGDTNGFADAFLRDLRDGTTIRISVG
jgi:Tol biopolymer transport system component